MSIFYAISKLPDSPHYQTVDPIPLVAKFSQGNASYVQIYVRCMYSFNSF